MNETPPKSKLTHYRLTLDNVCYVNLTKKSFILQAAAIVVGAKIQGILGSV
jgi:hypothetical protein